jgi:hypothetical protein
LIVERRHATAGRIWPAVLLEGGLIGRYRDAEPTRPSMDDHPTGGHFQHRGIPDLDRVVTDVLVFPTAAAAVPGCRP